jgi:hypothetical protein
VSLAAIAATSVVRAQAVELEWSAPRECPGRQVVLDALPERVRAVALRARAEVVHSAGEYRLTLELESRSGLAHRTLRHARCAELAEAAAVLIALALENEASAAAPAAPEPSQPAASPAAPPAEPQPPSVATPPNSDIDYSEVAGLPEAPDEPGDFEFHLQLTASARADLGTFPAQPAWGAQAQLAARFARLYLALGASYWFPSEQSSTSYPGARVSGSGVFSDLSIGIDATSQPVLLTPQLNVELGRLDAEALGIAGPEHNSTLWIAFGPCVSVAVNVLKDWTVGLELGGLVTAYRAHWLVQTPDGDVPAFVSSSLVLRLALRIGYALR